MGVFNDVQLPAPVPCPKCGADPGGWQSKSMTYAGYDLANTLQLLRLNSRMSGEVHTSCDSCGEYIRLAVTKGRLHQEEEPFAPSPMPRPFRTGQTSRHV